MRIFGNMKECVSEVERDLWEMGTEVSSKTYQDKNIEGNDEYKTKEVLGYGLTLVDGEDWGSSFFALRFNDVVNCINYVKEEAQARLNFNNDNLNPGHSWLQRPSVWTKFLEEGKKFSYTYPERIDNQLLAAKDLIRQDGGNRQAIINIYDPNKDHINRGGKRRVPCTMYYQILKRGEFLFLIHNMRSCDLYTHFPIDLSISWLMAKEIAKGLEVKWPRVILQIGSLHAFEKDLRVRKIF